MDGLGEENEIAHLVLFLLDLLDLLVGLQFLFIVLMSQGILNQQCAVPELVNVFDVELLVVLGLNVVSSDVFQFDVPLGR